MSENMFCEVDLDLRRYVKMQEAVEEEKSLLEQM